MNKEQKIKIIDIDNQVHIRKSNEVQKRKPNRLGRYST